MLLGLIAVWKFLSGIFSTIFGAIFKFLSEHPWLIAVIVAFGVGMLGGVHLGEKFRNAYFEPIVKKFTDDVAARNLKIQTVEADSAKAAASAKALIADKDKQIEAIRNSYEQRITDMLKNPKIKTVVVPGAKETVYVNAEGQVSCRRFPDAFVDTINEIVDQVNGEVQKGVKTP